MFFMVLSAHTAHLRVGWEGSQGEDCSLGALKQHGIEPAVPRSGNNLMCSEQRGSHLYQGQIRERFQTESFVPVLIIVIA